MAQDPQIRVQVDEAKVAAIQAQLGDLSRLLPRVVARAINRTLTSARAYATRQIGNQSGLRPTSIRKRIELDRATTSSWRGTLRISRRPLSLVTDFAAKDVRPRGVVARIFPGRQTRFPRAFIPSYGSRRKLGTRTGRVWHGWGTVLMRAYAGGEHQDFGLATSEAFGGHLGSYGEVDTGARLVRRLPVFPIRGPSLAQIWARSPEILAAAETYGRAMLRRNIEDQVDLALKERAGV